MSDWHQDSGEALQSAIQHHQAGRLPQAEALYRRILQQNPRHAVALHLLGVLMGQAGRGDMAVDLLRRAIAIQPNYPDALSNLGNILRDQGKLDEAIAAHRQAIALNPHDPEAHSNLGNALKDQGELCGAIAAQRRAIALNPNLPEAHYNLGVALGAKGVLEEAIAAYRQGIALRPTYPEAHYNLGLALREREQFDEAITAFRQALTCKPNFVEAQYHLGAALRGQGQLDEAVAAFRQTVTLKPDYPEAYCHLGSALKDQGRLEEAVAAYRQAIILRPKFFEAHNNLGNALRSQGYLEEAISAYRQAIALKPDLPQTHNNLGLALGDKGELEAAIAAYCQAVALKPDYPEAHNNLGVALRDLGRLDAAVAAFRQAIALNPDLPEAHNNIGLALSERGEPDGAIAAYRRALTCKPNFPEAHCNLGVALGNRGQLDEAIRAFRQAMTLKPDMAEAHGSLVYALHFHPGYEVRAIADEQRRWNYQHAEPLRKCVLPHANPRDPERRLRIGYVSPDFRNHVVGRNMLPVFRHYDRTQCDVFCYADLRAPDRLTEEFRRHAGTFRVVSPMTDEELAAQIRADRIDVLVDLALHMAGNRMLVFARKPAPVQVTFAGYPGSTGLNAIDYRLSDPYLDPPGMDESCYSEQTVRLPDSFWCYDPQEDRDLPVNLLPALETGGITFGCLNNFCKINDPVLVLWARVLREVEGSRLRLLAPVGAHRERTRERLRQEGIAPARVEFVAYQPRRKYLETYHGIDIGLDTFPYNGHTTSLDSFWMGVPVVTWAGQRAVARAGWCQLSNLGLPEFTGQTPEEFVRIAVALAGDLPRLQQLRVTLRSRMERSPLMDAARFARNIEAAYRQMWRAWCARTC
jgi:protein O-GlcNAc transferase